MTNHIEQLMKAAGVKPYKRTYFECKGGCSTICLCPQIGVQNAWCKEECDGEEMQEKVKYFYPAFTPEKQIELIKLLPEFRCQKQWGGDWVMDYVDVETAKGFRAGSVLFEDALAGLVISLIIKKRIDKSEVRRILEDDTNL